MGLLDTPLRQAAQTVLKKFGTAKMLRRYINAPFDPATDSAERTPIDYTVKALVTEIKMREAKGPIQMGDFRMVFAAAEISEEVTEQWKVVEPDGQEREILEVTQYNATDQAALVELYYKGRRSGAT